MRKLKKSKGYFYYSGYKGSIKYSHEDNCYYGKIENIASLVLYEGKNLLELEDDFREAVRDYIAFKNI